MHIVTVARLFWVFGSLFLRRCGSGRLWSIYLFWTTAYFLIVCLVYYFFAVRTLLHAASATFRQKATMVRPNGNGQATGHTDAFILAKWHTFLRKQLQPMVHNQKTETTLRRSRGNLTSCPGFGVFVWWRGLSVWSFVMLSVPLFSTLSFHSCDTKSESWGNLPSCPGRSPGLSPVCRVCGSVQVAPWLSGDLPSSFWASTQELALHSSFSSIPCGVFTLGCPRLCPVPLGLGSDDFDGHKSRFGLFSRFLRTPRRAPLLPACPLCFRHRQTGLRVRISVRAFNDYTATVSLKYMKLVTRSTEVHVHGLFEVHKGPWFPSRSRGGWPWKRLLVALLSSSGNASSRRSLVRLVSLYRSV